MSRLAVPHYEESPMDTVGYVLKYGFGSVRSAVSVSQTTPEVSVLAALASLLASFGTVANTVMLIVLLAFMSMDFASAIGKAYRSKMEHWSADKFLGGLIGKMLRLMVVILAGGLDLVFAVMFPESGPDIALYTPVTKVTFCWLIAGEGISILRNVSASEGEDVIPAVIIRGLDRLRLGGREPPTRRSYDAMAIEGKEVLEKILAEPPKKEE